MGPPRPPERDHASSCLPSGRTGWKCCRRKVPARVFVLLLSSPKREGALQPVLFSPILVRKTGRDSLKTIEASHKTLFSLNPYTGAPSISLTFAQTWRAQTWCIQTWMRTCSKRLSIALPGVFQYPISGCTLSPKETFLSCSRSTLERDLLDLMDNVENKQEMVFFTSTVCANETPRESKDQWQNSVFMATICLHGFTSHLLTLRVILHQYQPSTQPHNSGTSQIVKKNSLIGVKGMKRKSQKDKYLQVLKNTSPEIKSN